MLIGPVDLDREVLVVAEIGNNHEGNFACAEEMIGRAAEAGAQAVKFQTFLPEHYVSTRDRTRLERLRKFALTFEQFGLLAKIAENLGLIFLSTPFDLRSADAIGPLCPAIKIASGDNTFLPLLAHTASFKKPILLSTGLADLDDIEEARKAIHLVWEGMQFDGDIVLLHCVSSYPTPSTDANLWAIRTLAERFTGTVGYSDHTLGVRAAVLSVALGARLIEKHFTLDKNLTEFRDHQLSADPSELTELVERVREANQLLGDGRKVAQPSEDANRLAMRRSIAAGRDLQAGTVLEMQHLTWVRPGGGFAPGRESAVLGRVLRRSVEQGEILDAEDLIEGRSVEACNINH
jgi:N-acetylneuraminate synthase/N,N'-diacetyllegionaminate synthase